MKAEILSTGDEVLFGDIDDTNSSWLSRQLRDAGMDVRRIVCTGDDIDDIVGIIREMAGRADIVLVTGGLGPTTDDLSAQASALASDDSLMLNHDALASMTAYFKLRGWEMSDANKKQAMLPSRAKIIENTCGTAPGFYLTYKNTIFFFMPGVPHEMKAMYEKSVLPEIQVIQGNNTRNLLIKYTIFGLPESKTGHMLKGFNDVFPDVRLGFRASFPVIEVKLAYQDKNFGNISSLGQSQSMRVCLDHEKQTSHDKSDGVVHEYLTNHTLKDAADWVASKLGRYIISRGGLSMEAEVGRLLREKGKTLAVAESCTGGLIADLITNVDGSSDYFLLSAVTYANDAKMKILDVSLDTIIKYGAVHEQTAKEMAEGVKKAAGADYGISTSGIAGPGGGTDEKPVGTVCVGIAGPGFSRAKRYNFSFTDRLMNKKIFAATALEILRREIICL